MEKSKNCSAATPARQHGNLTTAMLNPNRDLSRLPPTLWAKSAPSAPQTQQIPPGEHDADLVVIGGGFTGLSAALHAAKAGARVILLEAAEIGWGASGRNTGLVIPAMSRADPEAIVSHFGERYGEALVSRIGHSASFVFDLIREYGLACEATQSGWIQPAHRLARMELAKARYGQWHQRGFDVALLDRDQCESIVGSPFWFGGWEARTGGHVNPLALARGLARVAIAHGATIYTKSASTDLYATPNGWTLQTEGATIRARSVILATHSYSGITNPDPWKGLSQTILPVRSYQFSTSPLPAAIRRAILPMNHAMSDSRGDLHLARFDGEGRLISGCGLIFPYAYEKRVVERLTSRLQRMFPQLTAQHVEVEHVWHGEFAVTVDAMPRFYKLQRGLYAWLGCNGRGVALSCALGPALSHAALNPNQDNEQLPFTPMQKITAHWFVSRVSAAALAMYRMRDVKDQL
ncbi:glycine/D-amino acid oxidase-like deaminating enzyme [Paraburkholderia sp. WC7.3g]|uniref:NAD(P)/FAD-dependent oxidoreductase n=1 Tax=Paraburkholderia sp. WC7.3g TaxID=2991070 RepID=UPI003D1C9F7A